MQYRKQGNFLIALFTLNSAVQRALSKDKFFLEDLSI